MDVSGLRAAAAARSGGAREIKSLMGVAQLLISAAGRRSSMVTRHIHGDSGVLLISHTRLPCPLPFCGVLIHPPSTAHVQFESSTSLFSSRISSHGRCSRAGPALVLCRTMGATTFSRRATPSAAGITQEIPIQGTPRASLAFSPCSSPPGCRRRLGATDLLCSSVRTTTSLLVASPPAARIMQEGPG